MTGNARSHAPLLRLYPRAWRDRYEEEFLAVLEARPLSPFDVFDILLGAFDARFRPRDLGLGHGSERNRPMNSRIAGYAAIAGGVLTAVTAALSSRPYPENESGAYVFPFAAVALIVALIGLSAVQGRRQPLLTWAAVAVPIAGAVVSLVGMLGMAVRGDVVFLGGLSGWYIWSYGTAALVLGSILFAAATLAVGVLSRPAAVTLLAGAVLSAAAAAATMLRLIPAGTSGIALPASVLGLLLFAAGWVWLGYSALRAESARTEATAT